MPTMVKTRLRRVESIKRRVREGSTNLLVKTRLRRVESFQGIDGQLFMTAISLKPD